MALIAPGICRFTLHGTYVDRPTANIYDMDINSDVLGDRSVNIADQAQVLLNEWIDHYRAVIASGYTLTSVSWVDLDSIDGETGDRSDPTSPRTMPSAGQASGDNSPGNLAFLVRKNTASARGHRSGRTYWAGVSETQSVNNTVSGAATTAWATANTNFLDGINQDHDGVFDYDSRLHVVHTNNAGEFVSSDEVTSLQLQSRLATQRRRLRE